MGMSYQGLSRSEHMWQVSPSLRNSAEQTVPSHTPGAPSAAEKTMQNIKRPRTDESPNLTDLGIPDAGAETVGFNSHGVCWELETVLGPQHAMYSSRKGGSSQTMERHEESESTHSGDYDEDMGDTKKEKQQMNRKAAQMSRRRKKERIVELEQSVVHLARRNHELKVIIETVRRLITQRAKQQTQHEQRLLHYLQTKNAQLKMALNEMRNPDGLHDLSSAAAMRNASLLAPDFHFQTLGFVPPASLPMGTMSFHGGLDAMQTSEPHIGQPFSTES